MVTINKMREMLLEGFPEPQADLMARVFVSAHDELVTKAEFNELTGVTRDLAEAQQSNALGGSLEDFACDLVPEMLEKYWQMKVKSAKPEELLIGHSYREIDVVVRGTIAGKPVVVVCEVKATLSRKEVDRFLATVERFKALHPKDDIRPLFFGYKADRKARERIVAAGAAMVFTRGVILPVPN
jgi:hypothetical protein